MALEKNIIIVSVTVGVLGLFSVLLGFSAEGTRTTPSDLYLVSSGGCVHESSPAYGMALAAALLLLIAQIIITIFTGCGGRCKKGQSAQEGTKRTTAIIMFSLSWVTFAVSFVMFFVAAGIETTGANGHVDSQCNVVKPGIFASSSMLALCTVSFSICAYIFLNSSNGSSKPGVVEGGIAMGQPQFQPGVHAQEPQKGQQYYPAPGTTPPGYGHNTQSYV